MKSIFLGEAGKTRLTNVYSASTIQKLKKTAGLDDSVVIGTENIAQNLDFAKDADYGFSTWGMPVFTNDEIKQYFPKLKAVFYAAGSVQCFAKPFLENKIKVYSAWAANAVPVVEYTVSQIILANKGFFQSCYYASRGEHIRPRESFVSAPGNYGCKVGIIGAGMIGSMVIQRLHEYNMELLAFDPFLSDERASELKVKKCSLEKLFSQCQTISNHLANNEQTVDMLNYALFSKMKTNATFINTGRGAQVVESELARALSEEPDRTAVLDVTFPEPPNEGHPFYSMPNVFLTPHIAGSAGDEVVRMAEYMVLEFEKMQNGQLCEYEVTLEKLATMA